MKNLLTIPKSQITRAIFPAGKSNREIGKTQLGQKLIIQKGRVDGKLVYFLETHDYAGMTSSKTFTSIAKLAAEAA